MHDKITLREYGEAVALLTPLSQSDTAGGRAAAQVLLSAYNGYEFQLDITDLCNLSRDYYRAAITVIRGRVETAREPHLLVTDGDRHFRAIWERWQRTLHVHERGKETCCDCGGRGWIYLDSSDESDERTIPCRRCGGKGRHWPS